MKLSHIYVYILLYTNLMVITNQETMIDTHMKQGKTSQHTTEDRHQITRAENKRGDEQKNHKRDRTRTREEMNERTTETISEQ